MILVATEVPGGGVGSSAVERCAASVGHPDITGVVDPALIDGPPAPVPPAVMARNDQGQATVRAVRLDESIDLDGVLDEAIYGTVPAISAFIN